MGRIVDLEDVLAAHSRHMRAAGHTESTTVKQRIRMLRRVHQATPGGLLRATQGDLETWLGGHRSRQTQITYRRHLRGFYAWVLAESLIAANPAAGLPGVRRVRHVPRPCADGELATLLRELPARERLWALLAAYAGLRCCEIATLDVADITGRGFTVVGKGGHVGWVRGHQLIAEAAAEFSGPVVPHPSPDPARRAAYVSMRFRRLACRLGLARVGLHRLRHWHGTNVLRKSNLRVAQQALRHADIGSTVGYTLIEDQELADAVAALPDLTQTELRPLPGGAEDAA